MQRFAFGIFLGFSRLITLLPYKAMFVFADILYVVLFYIIGYRKNVIYNNISTSFPNKSDKEIRKIRKKFYRHLSDLFIENIAMYFATSKQMKKRIQVYNPELFLYFQETYQQTIIMLGHYNNWEYILAAGHSINVNASVAYKPLTNKYFNAFYKKLRSRFGIKPFPMMQTLRTILKDKKEGTNMMYALVADQRPTNKESHIWAEFLNKPTKVFFGPEKLAKKFDLPVIFFDLTKIKRGHYAIEIKVITEKPKEEADYAITRRYLELLNASIQREPAYWLWSHKRWKKQKARPGDIKFKV